MLSGPMTFEVLIFDKSFSTSGDVMFSSHRSGLYCLLSVGSARFFGFYED